MLPGIRAMVGFAGPSVTLVSIPLTSGTLYGDLTSNGSLAAAFDNTTSQDHTASAASGIANGGWIGRVFTGAKAFGQAIVYGSNTYGFVFGTEHNVTLNIRGKNGANPGSATDGTIVGTITFADTGDESAGRTIGSTDTTTDYDHLFLEITHDGAAGRVFCAELDLWEAT